MEIFCSHGALSPCVDDTATERRGYSNGPTIVGAINSSCILFLAVVDIQGNKEAKHDE